MNSSFDLPAFLLGKLYDNMDWDNGWTLSDAIALAEDIRRYDGIDCDPQEMRCFLLRLGFIGAEYKRARAVLLRSLQGSSAFRNGGAPHRTETEERP